MRYFRVFRAMITALVILIAVSWAAGQTALRGEVTWISSNDSRKWEAMPAPALQPRDVANPPQIRAALGRTYQSIDGFGGCFNELGWVALGRAAAEDRARVLAGLFGDGGCGFTLARLPIGASDFALSYYSLDDTPDDYELKDFSIDRDREHLLPYIRAAMAIRPDLQCWGSPWTPPAWMKTNNHYSSGSLRWEPEILASYATYLARWVEAYREEGIHVYGLSPQNEPNILNVYPTCLWTGEQLREFIAAYLGPTLQQRGTEVELWLGLNGDPPNNGNNINDRLVTVLEDPQANALLTGVAYQYDSQNQIAGASELYADKKFMQSETECNRGENSWADAQRLYGLMQRYLEGGANAYFAWNMVLDETGRSTWDWRQNGLVSVNRDSGEVTFNGEYYVMRHFSQFVRPGAKRLLTTGWWGDKIAFLNPDGSTVVVVGNSQDQLNDVRIEIGGRSGSNTLQVTLPARSINTFVVPPQNAVASSQ